MIVHASDRNEGLAALIFYGASNSDDDYARYISAFIEMDAMGLQARSRTGRRPAVLIVVDKGNPTPNSEWRRKIADASAHLRSDPLLALVAGNPLARGVAAAINWLRPPPYTVKVFGDVDAAIGWVEGVRGPSPELLALYTAVRGEAR